MGWDPSVGHELIFDGLQKVFETLKKTKTPLQAPLPILQKKIVNWNANLWCEVIILAPN